MVIDGQPCEEKLPESPKSPMSLPASMELSPTKSPLKSPPASPLPMGLGLLEAGKEPTTAELLKRAAAQRKAEAPDARLIGNAQSSNATLNKVLRRLAIGTALIGILGTFWCLKAQTVTVIEMLAEYVSSAGAWGVAGFMATFVVYGVLLLPLSPIELLAGFLFPFWTALAICVAGKVTSSGVCFVIGRTVGAGFARRMLAQHNSLRSLGDAVASRPFTTALLLRFAYIPAGVKNYGLALTAVRLPVFLRGGM
mmetsp:Transcript_37218/g.94369  ORF Transcript_37218/g.94369 Transcript_37218/m.94369 type:complete len:253 (+) Transcript_37218:84-842(+)